jgi:flavodoxin I
MPGTLPVTTFECEAPTVEQTNTPKTGFKLNAATASLFALGMTVGMISLIAAERCSLVNFGDNKVNKLNGHPAVLASHAPSKGWSAGCYGDASLCAALLSARSKEHFQQILNLKSAPADRRLFVGSGVPKTGTRSAVGGGMAKPGAPSAFVGGNAKPGAGRTALRQQAARAGHRSVGLKMSVGLYFSTTTGNTETVAGYLADLVGAEAVDIGDATQDGILEHDAIIVGAPTWHTGADEQRSGTSWDEWLYEELPNIDLKDKKVAIFGVGDSSGYGDNFCDATGELYDCVTKQGAKVYGMTPAEDGIDYSESKGVVDGKFVGKVFDEDNYYDDSETRAGDWVKQLKDEGMVPA